MYIGKKIELFGKLIKEKKAQKEILFTHFDFNGAVSQYAVHV